MRSPIRLSTLTAFAIVLASAGSASAADCQGTDLRPAVDNMPAVAASTLCLINAERAKAGLAALTEQSQLDAASLAHSQDMVRNNYFAHDTPTGVVLVERLKTAGYALPNAGGWAAGENLAWGSGPLATPAGIVTAWMNSPGHRANILDADYREIGLGIVTGAPGGAQQAATYTTDFGAHTLGGTTVRTVQLASSKKPSSKKASAKKASSKKAASKTCARAAKAKHVKHSSSKHAKARAATCKVAKARAKH